MIFHTVFCCYCRRHKSESSGCEFSLQRNEVYYIWHPRMVDQVKRALERTGEYVRIWMRREILAHHGVTLDEFLHDTNLVNRDQMAEEIKNSVIDTQLIIAGFGQNDCPVLLYTDCVNIQEQTNPGFFCGGSGMGAALDWLNFRKQNCFMSTQRTFYHVREAKQYAELSPLVGPTNNTILIRPGTPMIDLGNLNPLMNQWSASMFPKPTDALDGRMAWNQFSLASGIN